MDNPDEAFGGMSPNELDGMDVYATLAAYNLEVSNELRKDFPEIKFELNYSPYAGRTIIVTSSLSKDEEHDINISIDKIMARVYERGTFWTMKAGFVMPINGTPIPKPRGGRRPGAGRPTRPDAHKHHVMLADDTWAWLETQADGPGATIDALVKKEAGIERKHE